MCECVRVRVCVCVRIGERERERENDKRETNKNFAHVFNKELIARYDITLAKYELILHLLYISRNIQTSQ